MHVPGPERLPAPKHVAPPCTVTASIHYVPTPLCTALLLFPLAKYSGFIALLCNAAKSSHLHCNKWHYDQRWEYHGAIISIMSLKIPTKHRTAAQNRSKLLHKERLLGHNSSLNICRDFIFAKLSSKSTSGYSLCLNFKRFVPVFLHKSFNCNLHPDTWNL